MGQFTLQWHLPLHLRNLGSRVLAKGAHSTGAPSRQAQLPPSCAEQGAGLASQRAGLGRPGSLLGPSGCWWVFTDMRRAPTKAARSQCLFRRSNRQVPKNILETLCTALSVSKPVKQMYLLDFRKKATLSLVPSPHQTSAHGRETEPPRKAGAWRWV